MMSTITYIWKTLTRTDKFFLTLFFLFFIMHAMQGDWDMAIPRFFIFFFYFLWRMEAAERCVGCHK